jgi:hypothetical protein
MDRYYEEVLPIDSILVHDMNTGDEKLYITDSLFFETISSVEEQTIENNLQLYPNPVVDILNINSNSSEIIISDIGGKVHYKSSTTIFGNVSLNVAGLPQGIFAIRSGNESQTFIKNTPSNGQDVHLISSSNSPSSLVKEAEIQSQFDYRFTIYSDGFKPKNYYTKALTKDTVVELDMSTLTGALDGKHIRVEFYINCISRSYSGGRNGLDFSSEGLESYKFFYNDTLVFRNGLVKMEKGVWPSDPRFDDHDYQSLTFEIDLVNRKISNFHYLHSYYDYKLYGSNTININKENKQVLFYDTLTYSLENVNRFKVLFKNDHTSVDYSKEHTSVEYNAYEETEGEELKKFIYEGSYIKIEFID